MSKIEFQAIDWTKISGEEHKGEKGTSLWQTLQFDGLRMRIVTYGPGYLADHWCKKGHIVHCLEGEFDSELENGETITLKAGMSYIVSDNLSAHRSSSKNGVKLLIIDGDFLKSDSYLLARAFTGMHDKNGKSIHEGDQVKIYYKGEYIICTIVYDPKHAAFFLKWPDGYVNQYFMNGSAYEVISS